MTDLPDVNLWVAMADKRHIHHPLAQDYWSQNGGKQFAFCSTTRQGFLRIITNAKAVVNPKTHAEAWTVYREFRALPNIQLLPEPTGLETHFHTLSTAPDFPHRMWTDAYLAAVAIASGSRLVSFDTDFARFPGLSFLHLAP
ncbi:MAG: TA system VapC family ribonuclease toxin [Akkermansiaceae bacterium]